MLCRLQDVYVYVCVCWFVCVCVLVLDIFNQTKCYYFDIFSSEVREKLEVKVGSESALQLQEHQISSAALSHDVS